MSVNPNIVELRMGKSLSDHIGDCITSLQSVSDKSIMNGLGEVTDAKMKPFVKNKLRKDLIQKLTFFQQFPIIDQ